MTLVIRSVARWGFKFSSLPTEIRLMIWRESIEPRILHITSGMITLPDPDLVVDRLAYYGRPDISHVWFKSHEKPPVTLQICRESRAVALKHYVASFRSTTYPEHHASKMKQSAVYFNPELDTVHVVADNCRTGLSDLFYRTHEETAKSIRTLAIESQEFSRDLTRNIAWRLQLGFLRLETLILVVDRKTVTGEEGQELVQLGMETSLVETQDRLILQGESKEWKLPVVKVTTREDFEIFF